VEDTTFVEDATFVEDTTFVEDATFVEDETEVEEIDVDGDTVLLGLWLEVSIVEVDAFDEAEILEEETEVVAAGVDERVGVDDCGTVFSEVDSILSATDSPMMNARNKMPVKRNLSVIMILR